MSDITLIFQNQPPIHIELYNTTAAALWRQLFVTQYQQQFPLFRDMKKYTWQYLEELVDQANQTCGWNFTTKIQNLQDTVSLHKHIEVTLANGYQHIPSDWDQLLDELHFALHTLQQKMSDTPVHGNFLQIEWFNDEYKELPDDFVFQKTIEFGSIRLQNAYVGHPPLKVYNDKDHANVFQTCRFHDRIKSGLHIVINNNFTLPTATDIEAYTKWWHTHAPEFVKYHGWGKIMRYTGHPVIGNVTNLDDLAKIADCSEILKLQEVIY
jgi:hypothetical protein